MKSFTKGLMLISLSGLLTACSGAPHLQKHYGEAHHHNMVAQTVHPEAQVMREPSLDGTKSQQVMETYRADAGKTEGGRLLKDMGSDSN